MITVFIPVYNEQEIIEASVHRVRAYLNERRVEHEILIVSNGSSDGTCRIGEELQRREEGVRFFHMSERGAGRALALGVREARGESVVCLDADLSSDLIFVDYAIDLLRYAEMVVGSKTMGSQQRSPIRVLGSQLYILLTNLCFGLTISDYSIGCKAFRRTAVLPVLDRLDPWTGHIFELCLYLRRSRQRVIQVGIDCDDRRSSRFNLLHEGLYRYRHLYRCWRLLRDAESWLGGTSVDETTANAAG